MKKSVSELADFVGGTVVGDGATQVSGIATLAEARTGDISFLANPKYHAQVARTAASALIAAAPVPGATLTFLITPEPYLAYAKIARLFFEEPYRPRGISEEAIIDSSARIGPDASVFPLVYIGERVSIGARATLYPGVYIGDDSVVGDEVIFYPNVVVQRGSVIGSRVILHPGVVIGADGFGYARDKRRYVKIPQVGTVQLDDEVEIGANSTVDRAALGRTWVKRGAKIDNLVMVGHNAVVGEDTVIVAMSGVSGSTEVGNGVIMAAQTGTVGHIKIGDDVTLTARAGAAQDIPAKAVVSGYPAIEHPKWLRAQAVYNKLPELYAEVKSLRKKVEILETTLSSTRTSER